MQITRPKAQVNMPDTAKKVHTGIIFDVYQWDQEQFDGTYATFERLKRPDTVSVIPITTHGKIFITKQLQPGGSEFLGLIGGRVDHNEEPLSAIKRELGEESGLSSKDWRLWFALQPMTKIDWVIFNFIAYNAEKTSNQKLDSGEKITLLEVTFSEFVEITFLPDFRDLDVSLAVARAWKNNELDQLEKLFKNPTINQ